MSFNLLKFGINFKKPKNEDNKDKPTTGDKNKPVLFPDCTNEKKLILKIKLKIEELKQSGDIEKLKEKKLEMLLEKLNTAKEDLIEKLNILTQDEIDPLCSFKEIQK
jgi:hypothetical protein